MSIFNDEKLFFISPRLKSIGGGEFPRYKTVILNFGVHEMGEYPRGNGALVPIVRIITIIWPIIQSLIGGAYQKRFWGRKTLVARASSQEFGALRRRIPLIYPLFFSEKIQNFTPKTTWYFRENEYFTWKKRFFQWTIFIINNFFV